MRYSRKFQATYTHPGEQRYQDSYRGGDRASNPHPDKSRVDGNAVGGLLKPRSYSRPVVGDRLGPGPCLSESQCKNSPYRGYAGPGRGVWCNCYIGFLEVGSIKIGEKGGLRAAEPENPR